MIGTGRRLAIVFATIAAALLLTGCGPREPARVLTDPPAPAQTGQPLALTPVQDPISLDRFRADPCRTLNREQIAALITDPPIGVNALPQDDRVGCGWIALEHPNLYVSIGKAPLADLDELAAYHQKEQGNLEPWKETSLGGLPVVVYHNVPGPEFCDVAIGVSDTEMIHVNFGSGGSVGSQYWPDRCGGALKAAEYVIGTLRH